MVRTVLQRYGTRTRWAAAVATLLLCVFAVVGVGMALAGEPDVGSAVDEPAVAADSAEQSNFAGGGRF